MTDTQTEAIAQADAHLNNAGLPTYSELAALLRRSDDVMQARAPSATVRYDVGHALDVLGRANGKPARMGLAA